MLNDDPVEAIAVPYEEVEEPDRIEQESEDPLGTPLMVAPALEFNGARKTQVLAAWLRILKRRMK